MDTQERKSYNAVNYVYSVIDEKYVRSDDVSHVSVSEASRNLSHWVNRAAYGQESIILESHGRPKAVLIGVEAFEELTREHPHFQRQSMSVEEFRTGFRRALEEAGYHTPDDIVRLIQEIKSEMLSEREQGLS